MTLHEKEKWVRKIIDLVFGVEVNFVSLSGNGKDIKYGITKSLLKAIQGNNQCNKLKNLSF